MAVQELNQEGLKKVRTDIATIPSIYWNGDLKVGTTLFTDEAKTINIGTYNNLGVVDGPNYYYVKTQSGLITEIPILMRKKVLAWQFMLLDNDTARTLNEMDMIYAKGIRRVRLVISMDSVYYDKTEWDADSDSLWSRYTQIINKANSLFPEISLRIVMNWDDSRFYFERDNQTPQDDPLFGLFNDIAQNQWGKPMRVKYGWGHISFAKTSCRNIINEFIRRVLTRYSTIIPKLQSVAITCTPDQENGYGYSNKFVGDEEVWINTDNGNTCIYDYTPESIAIYKSNFLPRRFGNSIDALNAWYQPTVPYASFQDVNPPKVENKATLRDTNDADFMALIDSRMYVDWYQHNFELIKTWWLEAKSIINSLAPSVKMCFEVGSSTDILEPYRRTGNLIEIQKIFDIFKGEFSNKTWLGTPNISADIVRTNWGKDIETEINANDVPTQSGTYPLNIHDTNAIDAAMEDAIKNAYLNGCDSVDIICTSELNPNISHDGIPLTSDPSTWTNQFPKALLLADRINTWLNNSNGYDGVKTIGSQDQNLSERVRNPTLKFSQWVALGVDGSNNKCIKVRLMDDITNLPNITPPPTTDVYKSVLEFNQQTNGNQFPNTASGNGYIKVNLPSHSRVAFATNQAALAAYQNKFSRVEYWIYLNDVLILHLKDTLSGFHPNYFPGNSGAESDRVWVPGNPFYNDLAWVRNWINNFVPFGEFPDALSRGNNHLPFYDRFFIQNTGLSRYKLKVKNLGELPIDINCGLIRNTSQIDVNSRIPIGNTIHEFDLNMQTDDVNDNYKINFNTNS